VSEYSSLGHGSGLRMEIVVFEGPSGGVIVFREVIAVLEHQKSIARTFVKNRLIMVILPRTAPMIAVPLIVDQSYEQSVGEHSLSILLIHGRVSVGWIWVVYYGRDSGWEIR
jgi:hypothetical protein